MEEYNSSIFRVNLNNGGCMFLWNFRSLLPDYMALHLIWQYSSVTGVRASNLTYVNFWSNWWLELQPFFTFWLFGMEWPHYNTGSLQWGCSCHSGNDNISILHWYYFIHSLPHKLTHGLFQRQVIFLYSLTPPGFNKLYKVFCNLNTLWWSLTAQSVKWLVMGWLT